jgi:hypothetical protein
MFRTKIYGNNPTHQVVLGFDDTLHSFFATVVDLDTHTTLFDVGTQSSPLLNLVDFQSTIKPYFSVLSRFTKIRYPNLTPTIMHIPHQWKSINFVNCLLSGLYKYHFHVKHSHFCHLN